MTQSLPEFLAPRLAQIQAQQRVRKRLPYQSSHAHRVEQADGRQLRVFCSNDYLGLADHPDLKAAWCQAVERYGVGSTASQYINGHSAEIAAFEEEMADFLGYPRVLLFGSGYLVNSGVIDALLGRDDDIVSDALNHASLIDGCRLSGARVQRYAHADLQQAEAALQQAGVGNRLLLSDALFSMDGDTADVAGLAALARQQQAWLMLDDAHGLGVVGPHGRGCVAGAGLGVDEVPIVTATLGKSVGVYGAFVAGSEDLVEYLSQVTRSIIFTTALPPALVAAARAGLRLLRSADDRRSHLHTLIAQFRAGLLERGLPDSGSDTPIQPIVVGGEARAMALSAALREQGFWISAIRPPTVPPGTCRLRVTLSAAHSNADVNDLLDALALAVQKNTGKHGTQPDQNETACP